MKNTHQKILLFAVALLLSACQTTPVIQASKLSPQQAYTLTDNYANHRAQQKYIDTSGGKLAYLDVGEGPVLVLLHGVPSSSWLYRKMIPQLQKKYRVIAPDFLGYGSSDKPKAVNNNYAATSQAGYVRNLLDELNIEDYSMVFHDMGGLVAWNLFAEDSEKIQTLYVLNTIISQDGFNHPKMKKGMVAKQYSRMFSNKFSSAAALNMTFDNMGLSTNADLSEAECRGYVLPMREGSDEALYEFYTGFDENLFKQIDSNILQLSNFDGQVNVFWGDKDKVLTSKQLETIKNLVPDNQLSITIFEEQGHFLPEEIPAKLGSLITN